MITFQIMPSSLGETFYVNGFLNSPLINVIKNFLSKQCPIIGKVNAILSEGNKLDINKTLWENKLHQNSIIVLMTENRKITPIQNTKKIFFKSYHYLI